MPNSTALPRLFSLLLASTVAVACSKGASNADSAGIADSSAGTVMATPAPSADDVDDRVENALDANADLAVFGLDADDHDGKVVLKGKVRTAEQKTLAEQVAAGVAAGVALDNRLVVDATLSATATKPVNLDDLEDLVEDAIDADAVLKPFDLDVDEGEGGLVLEGTVKTADQKASAETIAKTTAPAATIINKIKIG